PLSSLAVSARADGSGGSVAYVCAADGTHRYATATGTWGPAVKMGGKGCIGDAPHAISVSPIRAGVIFAATNAAGNTTDAQLYESDNGGGTWTPIGASQSFGQGRQNWVGVHRSRDGVSTDVDVYFGSGLNMFRITCSSLT